MMDPFLRSMVQRQEEVAAEDNADARERAIARMAPGAEVVDVLSVPDLTPDEEARVQAAAKAIRLARLRQVGARLKAAGRMPKRQTW